MPKYENIVPFGDRILVRIDDPEKMTESGLYLPDSAGLSRQKPQTGIVIAVGSGKFEAVEQHTDRFVSTVKRIGDLVDKL